MYHYLCDFGVGLDQGLLEHLQGEIESSVYCLLDFVPPPLKRGRGWDHSRPCVLRTGHSCRQW